jgi:hypothetical protein
MEPRASVQTRARGCAHVALAKRSSLLGVYDLREALESASAPLPVEFLAALALTGDTSCLEAIAAAHGRATDRWWREHLADAFHAIVERERLTRRHAVLKKIQKRCRTSLVRQKIPNCDDELSNGTFSIFVRRSFSSTVPS